MLNLPRIDFTMLKIYSKTRVRGFKRGNSQISTMLKPGNTPRLGHMGLRRETVKFQA